MALIGTALYAYSMLVLGAVLMSWMPDARHHPIGQLIHQLTEPVLEPARKLLPPIGGMDFSPIIVLVVLQALGDALMRGG